ncbi:uncharacterized protein MYCGRDRAFT_93246 [Zymoseptoria tritici IPO323]|uniref:Uncharacterized protein n=1 Tax=Zymoseptoria tritici (strain CBS 115943 / IPO323) TaxID=336722 RepID=F9XCI0_ZYMTI|nr:uncharacterized protein MYCGRDRAFT_93246 [Zymoseptoria tritici IPO323]EGP87591.1 hypothetical protein MYCGRDRAFT_93246 [Zymoseptoria tritici IPO323]
MQISKLAFILSMALATVADGPPPTFECSSTPGGNGVCHYDPTNQAQADCVDCSPDAGTGACVVNGQSFACTVRDMLETACRRWADDRLPSQYAGTAMEPSSSATVRSARGLAGLPSLATTYTSSTMPATGLHRAGVNMTTRHNFTIASERRRTPRAPRTVVLHDQFRHWGCRPMSKALVRMVSREAETG